MNAVQFDHNDIAGVWSLLDERTQLAIYTKVLEGRIQQLEATVAQRDQIIDGMRHEIDLLQEAVKQPELKYNGVTVA